MKFRMVGPKIRHLNKYFIQKLYYDPFRCGIGIGLWFKRCQADNSIKITFGIATNN